MNYTCDAERASGAAGDAYPVLLARTPSILARMKQRRESGEWPLLSLPARTDDLDAIEAHARRIAGAFSTVIVSGMGGSSLGGRTLVALAENPFAPARPQVHFLDNIDPVSVDRLLDALEDANSFFLFVSKSGGTAETLAHTLILLERLRLKMGEEKLRDHALVIAEPGDNALRRIARAHGIPALDHDPRIGGRYAALTAVGLLPAAVAGLDIRAVRRGAAAVVEQVFSQENPEPARGAALMAAFASGGKSLALLFAYCDRLRAFTGWYCQLVAESLGKQGKGITPLAALGACDQHSQLQLYLGGPRDKWITLVLLEQKGKGAPIPASADPALSYLRGRTLGDLMEAEQRATLETLAANGCPVRVFRLARLDAETLGALMMHSMLEVMIAAELMGVNAFDQPAVEEGKRLAREYLKAMQ